MATRSAISKLRSTSGGGKDITVTWTGLLHDDDGEWRSHPGAIVRAISFSGVFGGAQLSIEVTGGDATDPANPLIGTQPDESKLAALVFFVPQTYVIGGAAYTAAPSYRPLVVGGDGTTNVNVTLYVVQD